MHWLVSFYYLSISSHISWGFQDSLKEKTGWEGTGAGYEDVRVGFYLVSLRPLVEVKRSCSEVLSQDSGLCVLSAG